MPPPDTLRIACEPDEDARFHYIGKLRDGRQFMAFVTGAFPGTDRYPNTDDDAWRRAKQWLAVIHTFDAQGSYLESEAQRGGYDIEGRDAAGEKAWAELDRMLARQEAEFCDIYVKMFEATIEGVTYELVYEPPAENEDGEGWESVMLWPNDIMFHPPWDSGEYSS